MIKVNHTYQSHLNPTKPLIRVSSKRRHQTNNIGFDASWLNVIDEQRYKKI